MALLNCYIVSDIKAELYLTEFKYDDGRVFQSVRGKTSGAFRGSGTFQWTTAVQATCCLLLRTVLNYKGAEIKPFITGHAGSFASSLDYAISKETNWLSEMFGCSSCGTLIAKRVFAISNSNRKRAGPVVIAVNEALLSPNNISFFLDDTKITTPEKLYACLKSIEKLEQKVTIPVNSLCSMPEELDV